ncbi:MAG TPA: branched-chain amino acid ABC transporter permease, partial [Kiloniellaceae bacterium]|nr:branched-chain amino acid ABC transporter permease [Kiloniellaceae bacterium]
MVRQAKGPQAQQAGPTAVLDGRGVRAGFLRLAPVAVFAAPFGLAFGAAAVEHGLLPLETLIMSATVFAGAAQFAVLDLWSHPLPLLSIALTVLAVNARHLLLGAALSPWVNALPWTQRLLALPLLSDANFADSYRSLRDGGGASGGESEGNHGVLVGGGLALWLAWTAGTALGAYAGSGLGDLSRFGIDLVMACFFAAVAAGDLKTPPALLPAAVAAAVAVLALDALPAGWNIILAALAGASVGALTGGRTGGR